MPDEEDFFQDAVALNNFSNHFGYLDAILCRYDKCNTIDVDFPKSSGGYIENYEQQLSYILECVMKNELDAVFEYRYPTDKEVYCSKIVILATDNFQLINHGMRVIPMDRG